jgi:peptide deformylase
MAILKIAKMGHPVLRQSAEEVADPTAPEIQALLAHMRDTMIDAQGAGLAAPQVYVPKRVVMFVAPFSQDDNVEEQDDVLTVLINPIIEPLSDDTELGWEGCLSVPGLRGLVPRFTHIRYTGLDQNGDEIVREATGFHARVTQHECDHLDGILYPQRMDDLSDLIFDSEYGHYMATQETEEVEG